MGSFRSQPELTKNTYQMSSRDHSYAESHMCGWRKYMEDASFTISPFTFRNYSLFCVFDGHGGPEVALFAKQNFHIELEKNSHFRKGHFEQALKETFLRMDELIMSPEGQAAIIEIRKSEVAKDNSNEEGSMKRVGCTALVALVTKEDIYVANAGDCRLIACSYDKEFKLITKDHKPNDEIEQQRIQKAGGTVEYGRVNGCLNLTRAFGDLQFKENRNFDLKSQMITSYPDVYKLSRENVYFIMMGCDGIWECRSNQQIADWISKRLKDRMPLGRVLEQLLDEIVAKDCKDNFGTDNMSSILVKFDLKK